MKTWLLLDGDVVLASCETYRMRSFLSGEPSATWSVASVFVERALRGRGYASELMRRLETRVRELDPSAHALALYSDVGTPIYERLGYVARPAHDRVWTALSGKVDVELITTPSELPPPADRFLVWPTAEHLDWHLERKRVYAELLGHRVVPSCGARGGGGVMFWVAGYRHDRLQVLLWNGVAFDPLIAAARQVAAAAGFEKVVMWDQPGAQSGTLTPREGSLPMLRALYSRVRPDDWTRIPRAVWV
jgi:hypothetical protein